MPKTADELLAEARAKLERLTPSQAYEEFARGALVLDMRTSEQRRAGGSIAGAIVIDRTVFEWRLDPTSAWRLPQVRGHDARVIVLCQEGYSSSLAAATLHDLGLVRATDVIGGFDAWSAAGLPVDGRGGGGPRPPRARRR